MKDYYAILGVDPDATQEQIKSAYRRQVKKLHPDYYGGDSGPFRAVQEAYSVLSDPARRRTYDRSFCRARLRTSPGYVRPEPLRPRRSPVEPLIPDEEPVGFRGALLDRPFFSLGEIFDYIWGGFGSASWPGAEVDERVGGQVSVEVPLSPTQVLRGGRVRVLMPVRTWCPTCRGRGRMGFYLCSYCSGTGMVTEEIPVLVTFPAGIPHNYTVRVSLDRFDIPDTYLVVHFVVR